MKKFSLIIVLVFIIASLCACDETSISSDSNTKDMYADLLKEKAVTSPDFNYTHRDIDNNGTEELLIIENTTLTIYTSNSTVTKVGSHNFETGTYQLFYSENKSFPGLITLTVGGGMNHFGYITIKNNTLDIEKIYDEDYSGILTNSKDKIISYSENTELINEIQKAYQNNLMINLNSYKTKN